MNKSLKVPCICTNPNCGIRFEIPNPFSIGGRNNVVKNSGVNCPKCGSYAQMADHGTDSEGKPYVNLSGLFGFIRKIDNVEKLEKIKNELELNKGRFVADKLAKKLTEIDPEFSKFKGFIKSIKTEAAISILTLLILIITLYIDINEAQSSEKQFEESKKIEENKIELFDKQLKVDQERLQLSKDQFEYQKKKDLEEKKNIMESKKRISELEKKLEKIINKKQNKNAQGNTESKVTENKEKKINLDKFCSCGSGKKTEVCHPFGRIFRD